MRSRDRFNEPPVDRDKTLLSLVVAMMLIVLALALYVLL